MAYQTVNASLSVQVYVRRVRKALNIKPFYVSAHVNLSGQGPARVLCEEISWKIGKKADSTDVSKPRHKIKE